MCVAGVPVPERISVSPPGEEVEDRRVVSIRENFHAEEARYLIDQVRPIEERITDRGLQAVPDAEAGDGLDHNVSVRGVLRAKESSTSRTLATSEFGVNGFMQEEGVRLVHAEVYYSLLKYSPT